MLKAVWAVAGVTLRGAFRSRVALALMALLAFVMLIVPLSIRGDGSAGSDARVLLLYSMGLATALLVASTLWVSAATVSSDVTSGRIQLLLLKPVPRVTVWLGAWLGVMGLNLLLLGLVCGAVWIQLGVRSHAAGNRTRWGPSARASIYPDVDVQAQAQAWYERLLTERRVSPDAPRDVIVAQLATRLDDMHVAVDPGTTHTWTFDLRAVPLSHRREALLVWRFVTPDHGRKEVWGNVRLSTRDGRIVQQGRLEGTAQRELIWPLTAAAIGPSDTLLVSFERDPGDGAGLVIQPTQGVVLRVVQGSFAGNLLRAALIVLAGLAAVAALGVTMGCMASVPVAVFLAASVLLIVGVSQVSQLGEAWGGGHQHSHGTGASGDETSPSWLESTATTSLAAISTTLAPLLRTRALSLLARGERLTVGNTLRALAVGLLICPLALALPAWVVLSRREFGGGRE